MPPSGTPPQAPKAYAGSEPYVFVSYAHQDAAEVYPEVRRLQRLGCRVWYDGGIRPSSDWTDELAGGIRRCHLFLVCLSPAAVASRHVLDEVRFALAKGRPILAVHLARTDLPDGLDL